MIKTVLIETDYILPDDITIKDVAILITSLITWIIKDNDKFYPELVLKEALVAKN